MHEDDVTLASGAPVSSSLNERVSFDTVQSIHVAGAAKVQVQKGF